MAKETLQLNTLYHISPALHFFNNNVLFPSIFISSGSINVYASNSISKPELLSEMVLPSENTNISEFDSFYSIPSYIYLVQNNGTTTEIVVEGINILETLGELS